MVCQIAACLVQVVPRAPQVPPDSQECQESVGHRESGVHLGPRVPPEFLVFPAPRANKDHRVTEVNLECRENQDYQDA